MKKKSLVFRSTAIFLLLNFLNYTFFPLYSFALTSGPHQPEYTAYEGAGATDMVNLLTGDFTYNLPVLEVPGPEGGFSVPLSYHAGIGLDQEASWVGLGFSMNVGAIARNVIEYPDDSKGQSFQISRKNDDIARGWKENVPGLGEIGWDSNEGHQGTISLLGLAGASYNNGSLTGGNLMGVHFSSKKVTADPVAVAGAVATVASFGASAAINGTAQAATEFVKGAVLGIALETAAMAAYSGSSTSSLNVGGSWNLSVSESSNLKWRPFVGFTYRTEYEVWLDETRYEDMYGALYLGEMPIDWQLKPEVGVKVYGPGGGGTEKIDARVYVRPEDENDIGATSDMHYAWNGDPYEETQNPTSLAKDHYSIMGPGISGSIEPYRLDVGSLSMPRDMSKYHSRIALAPFKRSIYGDAYKVQYRYKGVNSNSYFFHAGGSGEVDDTDKPIIDIDNPSFGVEHELESETPQYNDWIAYNTKEDPSLPEYFDVAVPGRTAKIEEDREGLTSRKLSQGKQIEWYSNQELINGVPGYIDYLSKEERESLNVSGEIEIPITNSGGYPFLVGRQYAVLFHVGMKVRLKGFAFCGFTDGEEAIEHFSVERTVTNVREEYIELDEYAPSYLCSDKITYETLQLQGMAVSKSTIGGYSVTREDGSTYYYSLPVYEWNNLTKIEDTNDPDNITTLKRLEAFPSTWLLTAITGPDYYDRNGDGKPGEEDWGRWILFNYGSFSGAYSWRLPYQEERITADGNSKTYSSGTREQYYLNSIETRTHTALFIKGLRADGKSTYTKENGIVSGAASSLKLDEIVLLRNEDYRELKQNHDLSVSKSQDTNYSLASAYDTFEKVLDADDITSEARSYLNEKTLKRIKFNYSYELSMQTPNSFVVNENNEIVEEGLGKLTLESVAMYGANNTRIAPDFRFEYASNPHYGQHKWDGWGYYNPTGTSDPMSHKAYSSSNGEFWSLKRIITPLGSSIEVEYERDTYSSIAGHNVTKEYYFGDEDWSDGIQFYNASEFKVNEEVSISGTMLTDCEDPNYPTTSFVGIGSVQSFFLTTTVTEVGSNYIKVSGSTPTAFCQDGSEGNISNISGAVSRKVPKNGGDLRVSTIKTTDGNGKEFKTKYIYSEDGTSSGLTSGVVSKEPDYVQSKEYDFYELFDFPATPVMYGKVTVLNGALSTESDFISKQVYEFETPHSSMVRLYQNTLFDKMVRSYARGNNYYFETLKKMLSVLDIRTSAIGRLNAVKTYDRDGELVAGTDFFYEEKAFNSEEPYPNHGIFTEGTLLNERLQKEKGNNVFVNHRAFRTTKRYFPSALTKVITSKDGFTSTKENLAWDFITGSVLKEKNISPLGISTLSETVPAYHVYPEMGPKPEGPNNVHMLGQVAASYSYRLYEGGEQPGLIAASAQTWNKGWENYRELLDGSYEDGDAENHEVWRKQQSYLYEGLITARNDDGTVDFAEANKFDFSAEGTNNGWRYLGEIKRYDHFSMPLETQDYTGTSGSVKMGYSDTYKTAEAGNATYREIAFSGAEDEVEGTGYFGGEVQKGSGLVAKKADGAPVHTGEASLSLSGGNGFIYSTSELTPNRVYRASVWTNTMQGRLYYTLNGGSAQTKEPVSAHKAGDWYLINVDIPVGASPETLEVGVQSADGSTVYFDDFRFQPADAGMTNYVYSSKGELTFVLDNDNLYTEYEYDNTGRLIRTYRESIQHGGSTGRLLISESSFNYGRFKQEADQARGEISFTISGDRNEGEQLSFTVTNAVEEYGPYEYTWDFGDGTSTTTTSPSVPHAYASAGSKLVKLTIKVAEDDYVRTTQKTVYIQKPCESAGTLIRSYCELDNRGCYTEFKVYVYADGECGTYEEREIHPDCINKDEGCMK